MIKLRMVEPKDALDVFTMRQSVMTMKILANAIEIAQQDLEGVHMKDEVQNVRKQINATLDYAIASADFTDKVECLSKNPNFQMIKHVELN